MAAERDVEILLDDVDGPVGGMRDEADLRVLPRKLVIWTLRSRSRAKAAASTVETTWQRLARPGRSALGKAAPTGSPIR
jgi:hypothetical protein